MMTTTVTRKYYSSTMRLQLQNNDDDQYTPMPDDRTRPQHCWWDDHLHIQPEDPHYQPAYGHPRGRRYLPRTRFPTKRRTDSNYFCATSQDDINQINWRRQRPQLHCFQLLFTFLIWLWTILIFFWKFVLILLTKLLTPTSSLGKWNQFSILFHCWKWEWERILYISLLLIIDNIHTL